MTYRNGVTSSDSVNLGSNPSSPATRNTDVSGVSFNFDHLEQPELSEQKRTIGRTISGTVAALFVSSSGSYIDLADVDPWDQARDARTYAGPYPVVAHPPCQRWGKLWAGQPLWIKRTGERKIKGADDGCFASALAAVRKWGGVLEHPWGSHAWTHFGLNKPPRRGGWVAADFHGSWTCCVEQGRYGHYARKPTLLLAYGVELPELLWGESEARLDPAIVERMGLKRAKRLGEVGGRGGGQNSAPRIGTPLPFRDLLISIARTAKPAAKAA
jgi:hypothetical protein